MGRKINYEDEEEVQDEGEFEYDDSGMFIRRIFWKSERDIWRLFQNWFNWEDIK